MCETPQSAGGICIQFTVTYSYTPYPYIALPFAAAFGR